MSPLPFPTGLYRAIGENSITVIEHDYDGAPTAVCVLASSAFERAAALALLEDNSSSEFVVGSIPKVKGWLQEISLKS